MLLFRTVSAVLLASVALAAPHFTTRSHHRRLASVKALPLSRKGSLPTDVVYGDAPNGDGSSVVYDTVWAGAVLEDEPGTFTSVTGTFTVPTPTGSGSSAIWVGLDGVGCQVILQTGVDATIEDGKVSYSSWYEWYPDPSYVFTNISFAPNDTVKLTATAHTNTTGTVTIENLTQNQVVSSPVDSTTALCQQNAEWIVEDYAAGGLVQFDDFGTVRFMGAMAATENHTVVGPQGATMYEIQQNGTTLATASVELGDVVVKHVPQTVSSSSSSSSASSSSTSSPLSLSSSASSTLSTAKSMSTVFTLKSTAETTVSKATAITQSSQTAVTSNQSSATTNSGATSNSTESSATPVTQSSQSQATGTSTI